MSGEVASVSTAVSGPERPRRSSALARRISGAEEETDREGSGASIPEEESPAADGALPDDAETTERAGGSFRGPEGVGEAEEREEPAGRLCVSPSRSDGAIFGRERLREAGASGSRSASWRGGSSGDRASSSRSGAAKVGFGRNPPHRAPLHDVQPAVRTTSNTARQHRWRCRRMEKPCSERSGDRRSGRERGAGRTGSPNWAGRVARLPDSPQDRDMAGDSAAQGAAAREKPQSRPTQQNAQAEGGVTLTTYQKWKRKWHALPVIVAKCQIAWK